MTGSALVGVVGPAAAVLVSTVAAVPRIRSRVLVVVLALGLAGCGGGDPSSSSSSSSAAAETSVSAPTSTTAVGATTTTASSAGANEVQVVTQDDDGRQLLLAPGGRLAARLETCDGCGYSWSVAKDPDTKVLALLSSTTALKPTSSTMAGSPPIVGAPSDTVLTFDAKSVGTTSVVFAYGGPGQGRKPDRSVTITATVSPVVQPSAYAHFERLTVDPGGAAVVRDGTGHDAYLLVAAGGAGEKLDVRLTPAGAGVLRIVGPKAQVLSTGKTTVDLALLGGRGDYVVVVEPAAGSTAHQVSVGVSVPAR